MKECINLENHKYFAGTHLQYALGLAEKGINKTKFKKRNGGDYEDFGIWRRRGLFERNNDIITTTKKGVELLHQLDKLSGATNSAKEVVSKPKSKSKPKKKKKSKR